MILNFTIFYIVKERLGNYHRLSGKADHRTSAFVWFYHRSATLLHDSKCQMQMEGREGPEPASQQSDKN